jgi:hypothetical protein
MSTITVKQLSSLDGTHVEAQWSPMNTHRTSVLDQRNPRWPRHVILDTNGVTITRPHQMPVHLPLVTLVSAAIAANPTLASPPVCTSNPSSVSVPAGGSATFTAAFTPSETPITGYQWQSLAPGGKAPTNVIGGTDASLSVADATPAMNGTRYRCIALSASAQVPSGVAMLTVT